MRRRTLVAGLATAALTCAGAGTAQAQVLEVGRDDPPGDSTVLLNGSRPIDASRVTVRYDPAAGALAVRVQGALPLGYNGSINVSTAVGRTCGGSADFRISGSWYGWYYRHAELADAEGLWLGNGTVQSDGSSLTLSFQGIPLVRRDLGCVGATTLYGSAGGGTGKDDVGFFCLTAGCAGPRVDEPPLDVAAPSPTASTYTPGSTISARTEFRNTSDVRVYAHHAIITVRPPGSTHVRGPLKWDFQPQVRRAYVAARGVRVLDSSFRLPADAPLGRYELYATYRDANAIYRDGPSTFVDVVAPGSPPPPPGPAPAPAPGGGGTPPPAPGAPPQPPAPAPVTGAGQTGAPPTVVTVAGGLDVRVSAARGGLASLRRDGLRVPLRCSAACEVRGRLTRRGRTYASGDVAKLRPGRATLRLTTTRAQRRLLRRLRGTTTFTLRLTFEDAEGERTTTTARVRLR